MPKKEPEIVDATVAAWDVELPEDGSLGEPVTFEDMTGSQLPAVVEPVTAELGSRSYSTEPEFDQSEVMFPRLRLAQGLTAEVQSGDAKPGDWLLSGYEPEAEVTVVPVMFTRAREYRERGREGDEIVCRSPDAVQGYGEPGIKCAECPLSQWQGEGKKRTPPPCTMIYSYVAYSLEHDALVAVDFKRTSMGAAKVINTMIQGRKLGNFAVRLGKASMRGPKGTYYSPVVTPVRGVPQDKLEAARELAGIG